MLQDYRNLANIKNAVCNDESISQQFLTVYSVKNFLRIAFIIADAIFDVCKNVQNFFDPAADFLQCALISFEIFACLVSN